MEVLKYVGLNEREAKIYSALLYLGPSNISDIAKKTGIYRPTLYATLPVLVERGIISVVLKKKRKLYTAESPEKLKQLFEVAAKAFDDALPVLMRAYTPKGKRPTIKSFSGKRGIALVFNDFAASLKAGDSYYRYSAMKKPVGRAAGYLSREYYPLIKKKSRSTTGFIIANKGVRDLSETPNPMKYRKLIPEGVDIFEYNIKQMIYGDKVAFVDYNSDTAFIVESKKLADFQKSIFRLLWDRLPDSDENEHYF